MNSRMNPKNINSNIIFSYYNFEPDLSLLNRLKHIRTIVDNMESSNGISYHDSKPVTFQKGENNILTCCELFNGDIIALTRNCHGKSAFIKPLLTWMNSSTIHEDFVRSQLRIDYKGWEVDPDDPISYKEYYNPDKATIFKYKLFVSFAPEQFTTNNTPMTKEYFARGIIALNNNIQIQSKYKNSDNVLNYVGNVTYQVDALAPRHSRFLTLQDTMKIMMFNYPEHPTGRRTSIDDMLEDEDLLEEFYMPEHISLVRDIFGFTTIKENHTH